MELVKCHLCGYKWHTGSKLERVTCPSCGSKTAKAKPIEMKA